MTEEQVKKAEYLLGEIKRIKCLREDIQMHLKERFMAEKLYNDGVGKYYVIDEERGLSQPTFDELERTILKDLDPKYEKLQKELEGL